MLHSNRCLTSAMWRLLTGLCVVALTVPAALWAADGGADQPTPAGQTSSAIPTRPAIPTSPATPTNPAIPATPTTPILGTAPAGSTGAAGQALKSEQAVGVHAYEYQRDYVQYPTVDKDKQGYVPTTPDERNATRTNQFGDKYIEPMPTHMEARQDKQANWSRKLGRGFGNLLLGWMEIPHQMDKSVRQTDPATGFLIGVPRGVFYALDRTFVGVFEIATFPCPRPGNYDPIIRPEFLTAETWDEPIPVFGDVHNNYKMDPGKEW